MSNDCLGVAGWGCIGPPTVQWFRETSVRLKEEDDGVVLPGFAFIHIPLPEYVTMFSNSEIYGEKVEDICCSSVNTGMFAAFKEMGNVQALFAGHDHDNDFWGDYNGIRLYYGRKTGYGSYGPVFL